MLDGEGRKRATKLLDFLARRIRARRTISNGVGNTEKANGTGEA